MEKMIIKYLMEGFTQIEISGLLKANNIKPSSLSAVEKTIMQIKKYHNAKTMFHLGCILQKKELYINTDSRKGE